MPENPQAQPASPQVPLVEVVDAENRPLAVLPLIEAHRQLLLHRSVQVLVFDAEDRLFLRKRPAKAEAYAGRFDVSVAGHVWAFEALLDAALRELLATLNLRAERLRLVASLPASPHTGQEFVSLYSAGRVSHPLVLDPERAAEGLFVSREELSWLVREYREMLCPGLVLLWEQGLAFGGVEGG
jgi:isopentenyldiphosphate isomerase